MYMDQDYLQGHEKITSGYICEEKILKGVISCLYLLS